MIEKHLSLELCNTPNVFHIPLPFYTTQILNLFLNLMISANHDKVEEYLANGGILKGA